MENKELKCCGDCEQHEGEVKTYAVSGNGIIVAWTFDYCNEAVRIDKANGFTVQLKSEYDNESEFKSIRQGYECPSCELRECNEPHTCPFKAEILDDYSTCSCCDHCTGECSDRR